MTKCLEWASKRIEGIQVEGPNGNDVANYIGTHNGQFHCDEALACGLLQLTKEFAGASIVRTRESAVLDACKIVVDVGAVFDANKLRFDHHQREFQGIFFNDDKKTKLSSAGLIYKYYGKEIIQNLMNEENITSDVADVIHKRVYGGFIEHIDGIDNGIEASTGDKNYSVSTHLSARVGSLNIPWNEENTTEREMEQFKKAVHLTTTEFVDYVSRLLNIWLPARTFVEDAVKGRLEVDVSGEIIVMKSACPWKSHIYDLESEEIDGLKPGQIKYVLYPDNEGSWRIQCVSISETSFSNRLSMPEKYRGLRDQALSEAWGIPDCIFVHAGGFIGGNKTYEGALQMARNSLKQI